jgi:hypothetical protein
MSGICKNRLCDGAVHAKGLCHTCYTYELKHSSPRPKELILRYRPFAEGKKPLWCKNCGSLKLLANLRCKPCDQYWRRHRKERPRRLWDVEVVCENCARPLASVARRGSQCLDCYRYHKRYGKVRPLAETLRGTYGWCDCGEPAEVLLDELWPVCWGCHASLGIRSSRDHQSK